eukprot:scaffold487_cov178-Ochromonas_danica.AAC.27
MRPEDYLGPVYVSTRKKNKRNKQKSLSNRDVVKEAVVVTAGVSGQNSSSNSGRNIPSSPAHSIGTDYGDIDLEAIAGGALDHHLKSSPWNSKLSRGGQSQPQLQQQQHDTFLREVSSFPTKPPSPPPPPLLVPTSRQPSALQLNGKLFSFIPNTKTSSTGGEEEEGSGNGGEVKKIMSEFHQLLNQIKYQEDIVKTDVIVSDSILHRASWLSSQEWHNTIESSSSPIRRPSLDPMSASTTIRQATSSFLPHKNHDHCMMTIGGGGIQQSNNVLNKEKVVKGQQHVIIPPSSDNNNTNNTKSNWHILSDGQQASSDHMNTTTDHHHSIKQSYDFSFKPSINQFHSLLDEDDDADHNSIGQEEGRRDREGDNHPVGKKSSIVQQDDNNNNKNNQNNLYYDGDMINALLNESGPYMCQDDFSYHQTTSSPDHKDMDYYDDVDDPSYLYHDLNTTDDNNHNHDQNADDSIINPDYLSDGHSSHNSVVDSLDSPPLPPPTRTSISTRGSSENNPPLSPNRLHGDTSPSLPPPPPSHIIQSTTASNRQTMVEAFLMKSTLALSLI